MGGSLVGKPIFLVFSAKKLSQTLLWILLPGASDRHLTYGPWKSQSGSKQ
jgi:hypothetical protein